MSARAADHRAVRDPAGAQALSAGADAGRDHPGARRAGAGVVPDAAGDTRGRARKRRCRWCCWCTAGPGRGTDTASTRSTSGWPTAAGRCCRSTSAASTGFGKAFVNAGDLEWGRKMHDDLLDAVAWAVNEGIADPEPHRHHGRLLRRLRHAGGPRLHARGVLLRRRYRRAVQPGDAAGDHPALLGRILREPRPARRRSAHGGGPQAAAGALAAALCRQPSPGHC